jgi:nucleotidyltransferase/DNA polymerase involved in DNA repair
MVSNISGNSSSSLATERLVKKSQKYCGDIYLINENNLNDALCRAKLTDICGIGRRLEFKLKNLGIQNPLQINLLDDHTLLEHFGPFWSTELRKIGHGEETNFFAHIKTVEYMQSVGRTITGYGLCDDESEIQRILLNLLEEATYKLRRMGLAGRGIGVSLHGREAHWGKHVTLKYFVRHTNEIFDILYHQLYQSWQRTFPIIKFGVWLYDLSPCNEVPLCLLPSYQKNERVYDVMDTINNRFGLFTLCSASLMGKGIIRPEVMGFLGDKTFHGL